jgi:hypothetical protein
MKLVIFLLALILSSLPRESAALTSSCNVTNATNGTIAIITFNNPDTLYLSYYEMYIIDANTTKEVEAAWDMSGLKVAIVYDTIGNQLLWRMWFVGNYGTLVVTRMDGTVIRASGGGRVNNGIGTTRTDRDTIQTIPLQVVEEEDE